MSEYMISLLLVVLVSIFTVYPLFVDYGRSKRGTGSNPKVGRLGELYEKRNLYYSSIKDIELDRDMGKLSEQDYTELTSRYKEKAAAVTKLILQLESTGGNEKTSEKPEISPFKTPVL